MGDSSARASSGSEGKRSGGGRRPRRVLTPEEITDAAIRIADAEGLDAVSIRRIAADLDVRPMSLYNHFASKDELLGSMADKVVEEVVVPDPLPQEWRQAALVIARRSYVTFVRHPWLIAIFGRRPRFGPNATKVAKQVAQATEDLPLGQAERWTLQGTLNDYVLGHSLRAVAAPRPSDLDDAIAEGGLAETPELASLPDSLRSRASVERFEIGLQTVLDGIELRFLGGGD